jgi:hypothetical protein
VNPTQPQSALVCPITIAGRRAAGGMSDEQPAPATKGLSTDLLATLDHRNGVATEYGPGVGWPENRNTTHWLENRGTVPVVEISIDIVRQE